MKKITQIITDAHFEDSRLNPLNNASSKLLLQLFIACASEGAVKTYHLLYGWCLMTSKPESETEAFISSFENLNVNSDLNYQTGKVSVYTDLNSIKKIVNGLLAGDTFKIACSTAGIGTSRLKKIDFTYTPALNDGIRIRPVVFNETSPTLSRNMFEKYSFYSPYGSTPSFTLAVVALDKLYPVRNSDNLILNYKEVLMSLLKYLATETKLNFNDKGAARFGNIEFINGPCANVYERAQVYFENISSDYQAEYGTEKASMKVRVTILPTALLSEHLLINCFSTNGGQVILDEVKEVAHIDGSTIAIEFESMEPISNLAVSIWLKQNDKWQIWFKDSAVLLRNMVFRMGMVGTTGKVTSPFMEKVLAAGNHLKPVVEKAMEINRTSFQTSSIGGYKLDPWVKADADFNSLVQSIIPEKSEGAFFARGWNSEVGEHGALAFLDWFKKISEQANLVLIQDPYFDTVGLEFLARTNNSKTSFSVITCTQTPSNDDEQLTKPTLWKRILKFFNSPKSEAPTVPNRTTRLLKMLHNIPELFASVKITIYDYRNKTENIKNLLHDRYIIAYGEDGKAKGFHLSNSIQNATQNYPLLITPIPTDVLLEVEKYSAELINASNQKGSFEVLSIYNYKDRQKNDRDNELNQKTSAPDEILFNSLKSFLKNDEKIDYDGIKDIFIKGISGDATAFARFWDTFGYFLAHIPGGGELHYKIKEWFPKNKAEFLSEYLYDLSVSEDKETFGSGRDLSRSGYQLLFSDDFNDALESSFGVEQYFHDDYGYGNYAAKYASSALRHLDFKKFDELLERIVNDINVRKKIEHLSEEPIIKVTAILFADLVKQLFWNSSIVAIQSCLTSKSMPLRTLGITAIITNAVKQKEGWTFIEAKSLFDVLSFAEKLKAYTALLHESRKERGNSQINLRKNCFEEFVILLKGKAPKVIFECVEGIILNKYFEAIDAHTTNSVIIPLLDSESITVHQVQEFWKTKFEKELLDCDIHSKGEGILDVTGWSISIAEDEDKLQFVTAMVKTAKRCMNTIRKPFASGINEWDNDYNRLLMIQIVVMAVISYAGAKRFEPAVDEKLTFLLDEVAFVKLNYPYYRDFNNLHLQNKERCEKFIDKRPL